jgi:hypothetical protein
MTRTPSLPTATRRYREASGATKAVLASMHLAVAAVLIPVFGRRIP